VKVKTSITLSEELLRAVDRALGASQSRSDFIEQALRTYMRRVHRQARNTRELAILNREPSRLNVEANDVLAYQRECPG
jgi:metal-responsive CopG/Arc/MetJ family transcriptional regulator